MGYDMDAGTLLRWLKQEGDQVERGEPIAEIETDKVNIEIEAFESGVLARFLIDEGTKVPVGEAIAIIGEPGEQVDAPAAKAAPPAAPQGDASPGTVPQSTEVGKPADAAPQSAESPVQAAQQGAANEQDATLTMQPQMETQVNAPVPTDGTSVNGVAGESITREPGERIRASPLVRRIAAEHDIELSGVRGTGPHGRIVKRDIEPLLTGAQAQPAAAAPTAAPSQPQAPAERPRPAPEPGWAPFPGARTGGERRELSRMRQTIAKRMSQSFQQAPHFYVSSEVDMDRALDLRQQVNADLDDASKLSVNDLIVKAAALALRDFPVLNGAYVDGELELYPDINIGIAVALDAGLISPFIRQADAKSLGAIARLTKDLVGRARDGQLKPEEYADGTFTISNLGMYDVSEFIAIINPPQAAILAVGSALTRPRWNEASGAFEPARIMKVTMSADHRVTDGAEVARYLQRLKELLQHPMSLLVG